MFCSHCHCLQKHFCPLVLVRCKNRTLQPYMYLLDAVSNLCRGGVNVFVYLSYFNFTAISVSRDSNKLSWLEFRLITCIEALHAVCCILVTYYGHWGIARKLVWWEPYLPLQSVEWPQAVRGLRLKFVLSGVTECNGNVSLIQKKLHNLFQQIWDSCLATSVA